MDVSRLVLVAAAALVLAMPVVHAQESGAVAAQTGRPPGPPKPWKQVRGLGRVLDLSKPPVVIDEPGLYAIQRNWRFSSSTTEAVSELIQIAADDVTLDLHGFTIVAEGSAPPVFTLLAIGGSGAEIRNGGLEAPGEGANVVLSTSPGAWLHHLSVNGLETGMRFDGDNVRITDSQIRGRVALAGASSFERNTVFAAGTSAVSLGYGNRVVDNDIEVVRGAGVWLVDNGNVVAYNVVRADGADEAFDVQGDNNVLRGNIVGSTFNVVLRVRGTANTLDGNVAAPPEAGGRSASVGIEFTANGNYYGNNRMAAFVPFSLGGTVQTDWGGNVGY